MPIEKIESTCAQAQSANILADNIAKLKALFPELVTENTAGAAINVDVLKALVGDATVTDADEKYGLNWHGKRRARQLALTPSTGTLRPCPDESVDWDTTQNLMIEGDNLEVLKLLQKSYSGKVKLIYIDPPYNTGKDFVYPDNFQDNIKNYLELTGQVEGGAKISSNTESSGRFHTDWLNMMYPRLKLARNLLREDGVIFISIDDGELGELRLLCDDVFGENNLVCLFSWQTMKGAQGMPTRNMVVPNTEYIYVCAKNINAFRFLGLVRDGVGFSNPDNDLRGVWKRQYLQRLGQGLPVRHIRNPANGQEWSFETPYAQEKINEWIKDDRIIFPQSGDGYPARKEFLSEYDNAQQLVTSLGLYPTKSTTEKLYELFDHEKVFSNPKPDTLIATLMAFTLQDGIVLDFFAGSGTTGHAVMAQNAADGGSRRYVLVQLPEPLDPANKDQKTAANFCDQLNKPRTIAELTKERLRRAATKIRAANADRTCVTGQLAFEDSAQKLSTLDLGFRVFKLDTSNIRAWQPTGNLTQDLVDNVQHLQTGRSDDDVLYELLLKLGLDLCVPIETRSIAGKAVHGIGAGVLLVCLDASIGVADAEGLALGMADWHKELAPVGDTTAVFRDSAFENDVAKSNLAAILEQHGIKQVRSL